MRTTLRLAVAVVAIAALPAAADLQVVAEVPFAGPGRFPSAVAVDPVERKAFVAVGGLAPALRVIDMDTLAVREIPLAGWPMALLADAARGRVHVLNRPDIFGEEKNRLAVIDTRNETVVADVGAGGYSAHWAADFGRREIYVSDDRALVTIDADTYRIKARINVGIAAAGIAVDRVRQRIVVGNQSAGDARVAVVDTRTATVASWPHAMGRDDGSAPDGSYATAWPVVDERSGAVYMQHDGSELTLLLPPDYVPAREFDRRDTWFLEDQASFSAAWNRLYQIGLARACVQAAGCATSGPSDAAVRAVDGVTGRIATTALPDDGNTRTRTVIVDDDGGDVYVAFGLPVPRLFRIDPATLRVRETLIIANLDATLAFLDPGTRRLFLVGTNRIHVVATVGERAGTRIAAGFSHPAFDHFFVTADPTERRLIDDGRYGSDWTVSDDLFRVWSGPVPGSVPVCRFHSARFAPKSSHVYTPHAAECETLKSGGEWQYEGIAFHVALPDAAGACPVGTEPLYRLYNGGKGGAPNHRYTTSAQTLAAMTASGWSAEGEGPGAVFACAPTLR
jgi:DNA-binding beta-propeller fold protein YncE